MTRREAILQAAKAALAGTTGVSTRIYRMRAAAFIRQEAPALNLEPIVDVPGEENLGRLTWELTFQVTASIRAEEPDSSGDQIVEDIHEKLMTNAPLNALIVGILPGPTTYSIYDADQPLGIIEMQFKATYQTALADLSSV